MLHDRGIPDLSELIENMDDSQWYIRMAHDYLLLRGEFLRVAEKYIDLDDLERIKNHYSGMIDSPRKLNRIKNLKDLLEILEKRDILSIHCIEPFDYLWNEYIKGQDEQSKILKAQIGSTQDLIDSLPLPRKSYNMYLKDTATSIDEEDINQENLLTAQKSWRPLAEVGSNTLQDRQSKYESHPPKNESEIQKEVLSYISQRIGRNWRKVARSLNVLESQIDAIQNKYPSDLQEQSYEALKVGISLQSSEKWKTNILKALDDSRRKDIKEAILEIFLN